MTSLKTISLLAVVGLLLISCNSESKPAEAEGPAELPKQTEGLSISKAPFGESPDGPVDIYTFTNKNGIEARVINYGALLVSLKTPDRNGQFADIVLGFDSLAGYLGEHPYFGATIGRYSNRIAKGQFTLDGETYTLATNNGQNHLHGGPGGFDRQLWTAEELKTDDAIGVKLTYVSEDMEEGYPGRLTVETSYLLNNKNELYLQYSATSDKATICNLTNHTYFNLKGKGDILDHQLMIKANHITPVDETLIPTGKLMAVKGTPFDFTNPKAIGAEINGDHEQMKIGGGYDHNYVIKKASAGMELIAYFGENTTGRTVEVYSEEPGVQFYSGNFLNGSVSGKGTTYEYRTGFCLETQHFPDSPNQSGFPSTRLGAGKRYKTQTMWRFSAR
ncbi:MAG: galactose mutarotase [Saprospiraceae bacterium]|nr:galactose mutarotase [Saprospiraceae bacterium]